MDQRKAIAAHLQGKVVSSCCARAKQDVPRASLARANDCSLAHRPKTEESTHEAVNPKWNARSGRHTFESLPFGLGWGVAFMLSATAGRWSGPEMGGKGLEERVKVVNAAKITNVEKSRARKPKIAGGDGDATRKKTTLCKSVFLSNPTSATRAFFESRPCL